MTRLIALLAFVTLSSLSVAQKKDKEVKDYLPTENLDARKDANKSSVRSKKRKYDVIYRPNPNKILYGNPCAVEATHNMGFEYLVEPRGINGSRSQKGKFLNNLKVKTKLVFTRSPFWKMILNKKFKRCRTMSGDITG